ncbi:MAG: WXG100 family type VII secretion target [Anaerorhabdus sp.]
MRKIYVDPSRLNNNAIKIEQESSEYSLKIKQLLEEVEKMKSAWQGKDNLAFTNRIYSMEQDFKQVTILSRQYAEFLRTSAKAYQEIQEELIAQANRL